MISSRVQTPDGRWLALDGRYRKRQQRMLGGLYESVMRSELTAPLRDRAILVAVAMTLERSTDFTRRTDLSPASSVPVRRALCSGGITHPLR